MRSILFLFGVLLSVILLLDDSVSMIPAIVDTKSITIILFLGVYMGVLVTYASYVITQSAEQRLIKKNDEMKFKAILDSFNGVRFIKRVGDLSYFSYGNFSLVYNIGKKSFFIFQGEECIATSMNITDTETFKNLEQSINSHFEDQMNDCVIVNGMMYSKNLFPKDTFEQPFMTKYDYAEEREDEEEYSVPEKKQEEFNIDDILDKINLQGMASLTKRELDFLKNQKG